MGLAEGERLGPYIVAARIGAGGGAMRQLTDFGERPIVIARL